jgi:hypothetical protein
MIEILNAEKKLAKILKMRAAPFLNTSSSRVAIKKAFI